ncbi:MAG: EAL domain-containing protein [Leptospiraceae bacterium]|nr:EAL domain-containing protein [Leptospiraceae bacterium]
MSSTKEVDWLKEILEGEIFPYFQPIISIENKAVFGYESLARLKRTTGEIVSIGDFFTLQNQKNMNGIEDLLKLRSHIDEKLRRAAFEKFKDDKNENSKLFINISPSNMLNFLLKETNKIPHSISLAREFNISPKRIVIEITEEHLETSLESIRPLVDLYKHEGFLIAVDDVGSKSSNLDRIGTFHPDIIKVDMQMLRLSLVQRSYKEILYTLSRLSQSLGISLLFEGIESLREMNKAMSFGARYLQGFLFSKAQESLAEKKSFEPVINELLNSFYQLKVQQIQVQLLWEEKFETLFSEVDWNEQKIQGGVLSAPEKIFEIDSTIYRFFITDKFGNQLTPNYIKEQNMIKLDWETQHKNWSWRPYFINHLYASTKRLTEWVISEPYTDIKDSTLLRTFSRTIFENRIIFVDVIVQDLDDEW